MNSKKFFRPFIRTCVSLALAVAMLFSLVSVSAVVTADGVYIYVSVDNGKDNNPGTFEQPLKTITAARDMAKNYAGQEVHVVIRGGTYRLSESIVFGAEDSGTAENPIVYESYEGEEVNLKASVELDETKAQPVTDEAILNRMYEKVRDKVVVIDLAEQGIKQSEICDTSYVNGIYGLVTNNGYNAENNAIYINDKEQALARYPNDNHYAHSPRSLTRQTMYYSEDNPARWAQAKNFWIGIWAAYDFSYDRMSVKSIDPVAKTLTVVDNPVEPLTSAMSRRWAAFNLLEEIDIPGEYYIDRDNMKLYLYPPYSLKDVKLEMSVMPTPILNITNTKNVTFKDLNFSQTRGNAVMMREVDNIDFIGCVFRDISYTAIQCTGSTKAITNANHWHTTVKNASYRINVDSCDFYNMGCSAMNISGGDVDTLTPSENVIENCFISGTSQKSWWDAIELKGCGATVRNNNINNTRKQVIYPQGNDHLIEYNEIYDAMRETGDAGAIYWGADVVFQGTMVQYNYIHDSRPIEPTGAATIAIYWDDGQIGQAAQYNIIKGMQRDLNANAAGAFLHQYNTTIDCDSILAFHANAIREGDVVTRNAYGTVEDQVNDIYDKELYYNKYPYLNELAKNGTNPKKFTKVIGNLAFDSGPDRISDQDKRYGTFEGNQSITGKEHFVDPENQDWRLKSDSELAKTNPNILNDSNFDMDSIGLQRDFVLDENTAPFRLTYPKNGESAVSTANTELVWDKAYGAHKYRLIVATDKELTNRVYDEVVSYNDISLTNLEKGKTYYWTVYALNWSREIGNEWQASNGVWAFSTALYEPLDVSVASLTISEAEERIEAISEGTEAGDFKPGSKEAFEKYLNLTKMFVMNPPKGFTSEKLNEYSTFLGTFFDDSSRVNQGFADLSRYFLSGGWNGAEATRDAVTVRMNESGNNFAGSSYLGAISDNVVYCFDAEFNLAEGGYMTFGLSQNATTHQWTGTNLGNYIVIKHGLLELQRVDGKSGNAVLDTADINLIDGKKHSFRMGRLRLGIGNFFFVDIDGERVFSYAAVDGTEINAEAQIAFVTYNAGDMVRLTKYSGEIPQHGAYEEHKTEGMYHAAKAIRDNLCKEYENPVLLSMDSSRFITGSGVYAMTHMPVREGADEVYVTEEAIEKILGCEAELSGGGAVITASDTAHSVSVKDADGVTLISLKEACNVLGKSFTYDEINNEMIVGDSGGLVVNNEQIRLKKAAAILKAIDTLPSAEFSNVLK